MEYTLVETDYVDYIHCIYFPKLLDFHKVGVWCSETYGHANLDSTRTIAFTEKWGFKIIYGHYNIYFFSDKELNWFNLRWS